MMMIFIFIICLKQIFLSTIQFGGSKKVMGVTAPNGPVSVGLARTFARKSSIADILAYAGG